MTNKNNRYASFLLPNIFYKFHAPKHIMILKKLEVIRYLKIWFKIDFTQCYCRDMITYIAYIFQRKTHIVYIRKFV